MSPVPDRAQLRRDEILEAAERIFASKGYHAAGIADIASELGIGHGTFYRYFKSKHDVAMCALERVIARMAAIGLAEDPEASETIEQYRAQVDRILTGMLALTESHPHVWRLFHQQASAIDPERLALVLDGHVAFTARFLVNGVNKGFLRADVDVEPTAQALVGLIFEGTRRAMQVEDAAARRRFVDAGMALMFDGITR